MARVYDPYGNLELEDTCNPPSEMGEGVILRISPHGNWGVIDTGEGTFYFEEGTDLYTDDKVSFTKSERRGWAHHVQPIGHTHGRRTGYTMHEETRQHKEQSSGCCCKGKCKNRSKG